jgi:hypothetical protein
MNLPLTLNPEETFQITLFDIFYNIRQLWNTVGQFWTLDIRDSDNNALVLGVKLVCGIFLLDQYPQVRFNLKCDNDLTDPSRDNLTEFPFEVTNKDV